jgi:hypothetical protein
VEPAMLLMLVCSAYLYVLVIGREANIA